MAFKGLNFMENNNFIYNIRNVLDRTNNKEIDSLYNDMSKYQKRIFDSWSNDIDKFADYSLNELLFDFDKEFIEKLLELELNIYLNERLDKGEYNKRNGYTQDINLTLGNTTIDINRPRLRNEKEFDSIFLPKRTRIIKDLHENILLLYSKNNSVNDIKDILKCMFNIDISTGKISELLQDVSENVYEWRNKKLDKCYFTTNIDCTYISIRDNKNLVTHKIPIYVVVGTKLSGHKEIIGVYLGNEDENKNIMDKYYNENVAESTTFWITVFEDLKKRGVEKILYVVSDGLKGIENAVKQEFEGAFYQRCIVHVVRNLKTYTNKNNCKQVIHDFKNIYSAPTKELALENYNYFLEKYKDNTTIINHVEEYIEYVIPLFNLPTGIRKYIYTNNIVESVNSKIKRGFYGRGSLPNANSALNIIFLNLNDLEKKWKEKKVSNWNNIYNELMTVHYEDIKEYL